MGPAGIGSGGGAGGRRAGRGRDRRVVRAGACRRVGRSVAASSARVALAGVDDLMAEWEVTAEIARYHYDRRMAVTGQAEMWEVLNDVERVMRASAPLPHAAPRVEDVAVLLELIAGAEDAYQRLIERHVEHAGQVLAGHAAAAVGAQMYDAKGGDGRALHTVAKITAATGVSRATIYAYLR